MIINSLRSCKNLSKWGAVLIGLSLIGIAAWFAYHMQLQWLPFAEAMADGSVEMPHRLRPDQLKEFESHVNFFLWLLPFVTASLGTNILSDALLRGFTYQDQWIPRRVVCNIFSGKGFLGSRSYKRIPLAIRRDISVSARRDLQKLLADLPQFSAIGEMGRLINMTNGSIVMPYSPRADADVFSCKLTISWTKEATPVDVDAKQYLEVQFHLANSLGFNPSRSRRKADELLEEISGW
jgi:hypothetical protein